MRQRTSRALAAVVAACALAGCTTAAGGTVAGEATLQRTAASSASGAVAAQCRAGALTLAEGPGISPMTGEHGMLYEVVNHGPAACSLAGYPRLRLYAGTEALPFRYASGGGPYVTARPPGTVTVKPGGAAWILVAKYRCDLGGLRDATTISLTLPGTAGAALSSPVPHDGAGASALTYCRGGAADPGQTVTVSPVEPAPDAVSR